MPNLSDLLDEFYNQAKATENTHVEYSILMRPEVYNAIQVEIARKKYRLACQIRRIRSQTHHERLDCLQAIQDAKQGSFLPLIVDVNERLAATNLCGHHMMAAAVESERLRWADPLAFRQRSHDAEYSVTQCLVLHHREAIASFRLCRRLP